MNNLNTKLHLRSEFAQKLEQELHLNICFLLFWKSPFLLLRSLTYVYNRASFSCLITIIATMSICMLRVFNQKNCTVDVLKSIDEIRKCELNSTPSVFPRDFFNFDGNPHILIHLIILIQKNSLWVWDRKSLSMMGSLGKLPSGFVFYCESRSLMQINSR